LKEYARFSDLQTKMALRAMPDFWYAACIALLVPLTHIDSSFCANPKGLPTE
jgi:hypothetical protein